MLFSKGVSLRDYSFGRCRRGVAFTICRRVPHETHAKMSIFIIFHCIGMHLISHRRGRDPFAMTYVVICAVVPNGRKRYLKRKNILVGN